MNVLVACEESQRVTTEFRRLGHNAFSCDIESESGGHPEWHINEDVLPLLNGHCTFKTVDGVEHNIPSKWDMIIAFPPCTFMTTAGACRMYHKQENGLSILDEERVKKMIISRDLFMSIFNSSCEKICIENPTPMKLACLPKPSQIIQPYQFGHPYSKRTCLWLKGLKPLKPTEIVEPIKGSWVNGDASAYKRKGKENIFGKSSSKERSKTFQGIAQAMAKQWVEPQESEE